MLRLALFATFLAAPLAAFADPAEDAARLVTVLEANGCAFTADNGAAIAQEADLTQDTLLAAVNELFKQELVAVEADGSMKLLTDPCK